MSQLEQLNKQYRQLAREGRTDSAGHLKSQIHDANKRWDDLNLRAHAVIRRLRHTINVFDDYEATREALLIWLKDMDNRISKLESVAYTTKPPLEDIQVHNDHK